MHWKCLIHIHISCIFYLPSEEKKVANYSRSEHLRFGVTKSLRSVDWKTRHNSIVSNHAISLATEEQEECCSAE